MRKYLPPFSPRLLVPIALTRNFIRRSGFAYVREREYMSARVRACVHACAHHSRLLVAIALTSNCIQRSEWVRADVYVCLCSRACLLYMTNLNFIKWYSRLFISIALTRNRIQRSAFSCVSLTFNRPSPSVFKGFRVAHVEAYEYR